MFGWFRRDPVEKLRRRYEAKMREAKDSERFADRGRQAQLYAEAQDLLDALDRARADPR